MSTRPAVKSAADTAPARADGAMNIRRFVAENSRTALRQVREALGGDAIILANRSVDGGVEVLAAAPEAVDALTRRMTGATESSLPLAGRSAAPTTPTELGIRPAAAGPAADATPGRKKLGSLFGRRAPAVGAPAPVAPSGLSFADELAAASGDDEDFVSRIAPEAIALSRPAAPVVSVQAPVETPVPVATTVVEAPVVVAPVAAVPMVAAPVVDAEKLSDVVAREVSREVSREVTRGLERELGRDVLNDLTRDVSREVSHAVCGEVTRDVTREVTHQVTSEVAREFRAMQAALSHQLSHQLSDQLATLTWTDAMRRQPGRTRLMQDLLVAGFSPALARHVQEHLPEGRSVEDARTWAEAVLVRNLPVAGELDEIVDHGGVFALVGPTGVGKTTTVAKLAARFALKHGVDQLALITTDGFRIGAQDQLRIYGKILGIPVHSIHDQASLTSTIDQLANKKLVLIDTAGLGQRDERVAEQIAMLRGARAKRVVVLNATVDAETLDHIVATFADREFAGCVITKTDEAARLGPVLDAVIRHRLRIHHVSTGQKVPEDLERPDAAALVHTAMNRVTSPHAAFEPTTDDAPLWMAAIVGRAPTASGSQAVTGNLHA